MSREDPQLRIRLPIELKEKVEIAAKNNNRSLNSEIVFRIDASFTNDISNDELVSAKDALLIIAKAKNDLSDTIFKRTFTVINDKIRIGHTIFHIDVSDLDLDGLDDEDFEAVFKSTFLQLKSLGYEICEKMWDIEGFMVEIPKDRKKNT